MSDPSERDAGARPRGRRGRPPPRRPSPDAGARRGILYALLIAGGLSMMVPFFWMILTSLKTRAEVFGAPPLSLPSGPHWDNYAGCGTRCPRSRSARSS